MRRSRVFLVLIALAAALLSWHPAHAQKITGTITGTVTDSSGAAVSGATVTITNTATNKVQAVTTDPQGGYTVAELPESTYTVEIKATGFQDYITKGAVVHVATTTNVNAQMQLGSVSQSVTVQANAIQVQTDSAALGAVVDSTQVKELPLNGRNFVELTQLQPGVSAANNFVNTGKGLNGGVDMSINGNPTTNNLFLVDGVNNNDVGSNRTILIYPSNEAIAEFKMLLNSYGPEYGQASGGIISIVTRSGSNQFHGSAFYNGRNDALDSYTFFSAPNAGKGLPLNGKDKERRNDWGYSIGGPIKRDKLFGFFSEEWNHEIKGRQVSQCVPTSAELAGDFSTLGCNQANFPDFSKVPANMLAGPHTLTAVDPSTATMLKMLPLPTTQNGALNSNGQNWSSSLPTGLFWREENARGDYDLNAKNHIMGRYTQDTWSNPAFNAGYWGDTVYPALNSNWAQPSKSITAHWTSTITNSLVNDAAFNYSNNRIQITAGGTNPGLLAQVSSAIPTLYPESLKHSAEGVPSVNFGSYGGTTSLQAPWQNQLDIYTFRDDLSWIKGQHSYKFGAFLGFNGKNEDVNSSTGERPTIGAVATGAGGTETNDALANLELTGNTFNISETSTNIRAQLRWRDYEFYAGDTWKMSQHLTLSYGARYSLLLQPYQPNDQITSFQPSLYDPTKPASDACNGLWVAPGTDPCGAANKQFGTNFSSGTPGPNRSLIKNGYHNIAPRVGVIWDPFGTSKTVIRAGGGQFYQRERVSRYTLVANAPFALTTNNYARTLGGATPSSLSGTASPSGGEDPNSNLPNSWQWNFTIEQAIGPNTTFQAGYVGNRGLHLTDSYDVNSIAPQNWLTATFANSGADTNNLRPYPAGGNNGTLTYWTHNGGSNYNAFQAVVKSRIGNSLTWGAAYTWSHTLADVIVDDSGGGIGQQSRTYYTNSRLDYGSSDVNRPNMFVANATYYLPKLQGANLLERSTLGGWETTGIITAQNGNNFTIYQGAHEANLVAGASSQLNQNGALVETGFTSPLRPLQTGQSCVTGRNSNQVANAGAFTLVGYALGTLPTNMEPRGFCGGPNFNNTDFSVRKNWTVKEKVNIQFNFDFFNLFNHPNFSPATQNPIQAINCGAVAGTDPSTGHSLYNACSPTNNIVSAQDLTPGFGTSTSLLGTPARQIQYGLHFNF
ncbi:carboxypeptidase regulatory-like domain-containing protein [Alloacidobacterium dinghuense]|uniref:Carboxypeptidase regulatory-like domain-containing protein n=1 Tax=Alloacidobacterium dinghuense TaxID=2763107 RepID=A0A7G8BDQ0_9BACT|nr:carboxypeptidase-like regulatory domain-containing protein [Alloacidobacterium dinghuense]QNI30670.1 carboxypeptidase regulatory-like domain-containing protein [Alloacidobacterium dinghuense]